MRVALGVSYRGWAYRGWQSQPDGQTVQDVLEKGLGQFTASRIQTVCAGRTDAGVHALNQVVHFDCEVERELSSWVRGTNCHLPKDIAVQWAMFPRADFHARFDARGRRYSYVLLESAVRPSMDAGLVGWTYRKLDADLMREAAALLIGEHDFSAFRASDCQAASPVKTMRKIEIQKHGDYWRFDFDGSAFLHHMIRNLMGSILVVGRGAKPVSWFAEVLARRDRSFAAPTFSPDGLYFMGPYYDAEESIPSHTAAMDWLPGFATSARGAR